MKKTPSAQLEREINEALSGSGGEAADFMDGFRYVLRDSGLIFEGEPALGAVSAARRRKIAQSMKRALASKTRPSFAFTSGTRVAEGTLMGFLDEIQRKGTRLSLTPTQIAALESEARGA